MNTDLFLFFLIIAIVYLLFRLIQYDIKIEYLLSDKLTIFLYIFIPYIFIFLVLLIGFYLDLGKHFGGLGILFAVYVSKYLPNLSLLLSASNHRKVFLQEYFTRHHEDIIYGYLSAIMLLAFLEQCKEFFITILAFLLGSVINCKLYILSTQNVVESIKIIFNFFQNHYKIFLYAIIFYLFFIYFPMFHNFLYAHRWTIIISFTLSITGIIVYILNNKKCKKARP